MTDEELKDLLSRPQDLVGRSLWLCRAGRGRPMFVGPFGPEHRACDRSRRALYETAMEFGRGHSILVILVPDGDSPQEVIRGVLS